MKNLTKIVVVLVALSSSIVCAGENASGGTQGSENMVSKKKIEAVLAFYAEPNTAVLGVSQTEGGAQYVATVRRAECITLELFSIKSIAINPEVPGPAVFEAKFQNLIADSCGP